MVSVIDNAEERMGTYPMEVERVDVVCTKSFPEVAAALEQYVPAADTSLILRMIASRLSGAEIERAIANMVGEFGFMVLAKVDQGALVSLLGRPKKMSLYLIGSPLLANRMYEQHSAVGLYAPLRASVYEDNEGKCHFTYELPSSLLEQFKNEEIRVIARILDGKMESLAGRLAG
jgi:uncharacterized protein (DUF302 family)